MPAWVNARVNVWPESSSPELKLCGAPRRLVTVWNTWPRFVQVTESPGSIRTRSALKENSAMATFWLAACAGAVSTVSPTSVRAATPRMAFTIDGGECGT